MVGFETVSRRWIRCSPFVGVPVFFEARARGTIARGTATAAIRASTRQPAPLFVSVNVSRYFQIERAPLSLHFY